MTNQRKSDHIELFSTDSDIERGGNYFDSVHLIHRALPEISLEEVDSHTIFLRKRLTFPFMISAMTGGKSDQLIILNQNLARAAERVGVAMGVGSQRIALTDKQAVKSFQLRQYAPSIPLVANVGAVQLNYGLQLSQVDEIIGMLEADAICIHFNPLQEVIQPEGDWNFSSLSEKVQAVIEHVKVPVIAKEVGCGFSLPDIQLLKQVGIKWIDVAGRGGTSWSRLENHRRKAMGVNDDLGVLFQDWGIPTPEAIRIVQQCGGINSVASGGVRSGLDMIKSVVLGAKMCAMAAPLLRHAQLGTDHVVKKIEQVKQEFRLGLFLLGCKNINKARGNSSLLI